MINFDALEVEVKKGSLNNSYIFCGLDEELIKEGIRLIVKKSIDPNFEELNYIRLDGMTATFEEIVNACETMPFMGERKVVEVYRTNFLKEKTDASGTKTYNELLKYLKDLPPYTILIMYYVFSDKRENPKKCKKLTAVGKVSKVVYCDKLKRDRYYKKIEDVFKEKGANIGKIEVRYFADKVQNNFDIIKRDAEKVICYTNGREIKRADIDKLVPNKSEDDIFDLIDFISQRKVEKALDLMDELLFKADQHMLIISNIQSNYDKLYKIKVLLAKGKRGDEIASKLKFHPYVVEKLSAQCSKFSLKQLQELMKLCIETEKKLKSSGVDKQTEMELMLFKSFMIK